MNQKITLPKELIPQDSIQLLSLQTKEKGKKSEIQGDSKQIISFLVKDVKMPVFVIKERYPELFVNQGEQERIEPVYIIEVSKKEDFFEDDIPPMIRVSQETSESYFLEGKSTDLYIFLLVCYPIDFYQIPKMYPQVTLNNPIVNDALEKCFLSILEWSKKIK